jgi:CBS domain-containing protein
MLYIYRCERDDLEGYSQVSRNDEPPQGEFMEWLVGWEEGWRSEACELVGGMLEKRFGHLPAYISERLKRATADELWLWGEALLDAERLEDIFSARWDDTASTNLASTLRDPAHHGALPRKACQPIEQEARMQTIQDVMTRDVRTISPQDSVQHAAQMMDELNVGAIPVCDGDRLVGMITDRDITVRSTAAGQAPDATRVVDVMSTDVRTCTTNQTVDEVLGQMAAVQIRRVPVLEEHSHRIVGIVSLGDMATKHSAGIDHALDEISSPAAPDRSSTRH